MTLFDFISEYDQSLLLALLEHLTLVAGSIAIAVCIAVPLTIYAWRGRRLALVLIGGANLIQTVPSIALFGLMIPVLALVNRGIGTVPATIALVLYAILPIARTALAALQRVPVETLEAARAIGMTERQLLRHVALPLAAPGVVGGVRVAATVGIGVAAVAAYIGAGGLGLFIARGISTTFTTMTLAGALGIALLALVVELSLEFLERIVTPPGVRQRTER